MARKAGTIDELSRATFPFEDILGTGFDLLPSSNTLEDVEKDLAGAMQGPARIKSKIVDPLLGDEYEYVAFDCSAYPGTLNNNALVATGNVVVPIEPARATLGGDPGLAVTV